jgi:hypothetical protein
LNGLIMFLFIAYKSDSQDYCRNCLMASYHGDFIVENHIDSEKLVEKWSELLYKNLNLGCNESGYKFYIFKNGIKVYDEYRATWDGAEIYGYNTDEYYEHLTDLEEQESKDSLEISEIYTKAKELADIKQNNKILGEKHKENEKRLKRAAEDKEKRRIEFEMLKKEFEENQS